MRRWRLKKDKRMEEFDLFRLNTDILFYIDTQHELTERSTHSKFYHNEYKKRLLDLLEKWDDSI